MEQSPQSIVFEHCHTKEVLNIGFTVDTVADVKPQERDNFYTMGKRSIVDCPQLELSHISCRVFR